MRKSRRRGAARPNRGVPCHPCHPCHTVSHSVTHAAEAGRCVTVDTNPSFRSFHLFLLSARRAQDWPFIVLFLRFLPPANCSFSCQLLRDSSSHHRDRVDLQSNRLASSRQNQIKSAPISVQKPSTPATAPCDSGLWPVMQNHAAVGLTVTDKGPQLRN